MVNRLIVIKRVVLVVLSIFITLIIAVDIVLAQATDEGSTSTAMPKQNTTYVSKIEINPKEKIADIKKEEYGEYTLGQDDVIQITVRNHPEFSGRFVIGPKGRIQYPFIGDIEIAGLTKTQASEKIKTVLADYVEAPQVDTAIAEYNSKVVYVLGQVGRPGKYRMQAEAMPIREAVLAAGLPREDIASLRRALIVRPVENGKPLVKKVNLLSLLYEGNLKLNYDLKSGDIVYLPSTALHKVSVILDQIITPIFRGTSVYETYDDIKDNNNHD